MPEKHPEGKRDFPRPIKKTRHKDRRTQNHPRGAKNRAAPVKPCPRNGISLLQLPAPSATLLL